jgi:sirohydrochlorin cobaltochelatase
MEAVATSIRQMEPDVPVVCAYLELSTPDLASACAQLVELGSRNIRVVPMFLGVGRHAREDLPVLLDQVRQQHPEVSFELRPAVGEDPRLIGLLAKLALDRD